MNLYSIKIIKFLLHQYNIRPSKRLGQNFLIDKKVIKQLVDAADLNGGETVLEVGAGIGAITVELAKSAKSVLAVEKDRALIPILKKTTADFKNIEIIQGDILQLKDKNCLPSGDPPQGEKLVGNIPYYLTAPLIRRFLECPKPPRSMTLMVQKEMAQRICAQPPNMSILAVSVQIYAKPEIISYIPRSSFWPQPKVDSAVIKILPYSHDREFSAQKFFGVVRAGFSSPRKQLRNNLSKGLKTNRADTEGWLLDAGIAPERRAETLSTKEWLLLTKLSP